MQLCGQITEIEVAVQPGLQTGCRIMGALTGKRAGCDGGRLAE